MEIEEIKNLEGKTITITRNSGAMYRGRLSRINRKKNKICLTKMIVLDWRFGGEKASPKNEDVRWFDVATIKSIQND